MNIAIFLFSLGSMWLVAHLLGRARFQKMSSGYFWLCAQSLFGYIIFFLGFYFYEWHLKSTLEAFDLNNNGVFDSTEISSEQIAALDAYINDAGRNIFKIIAPIFLFSLLHFESSRFGCKEEIRTIRVQYLFNDASHYLTEGMEAHWVID